MLWPHVLADTSCILALQKRRYPLKFAVIAILSIPEMRRFSTPRDALRNLRRAKLPKVPLRNHQRSHGLVKQPPKKDVKLATPHSSGVFVLHGSHKIQRKLQDELPCRNTGSAFERRGGDEKRSEERRVGKE